MKKFSINSPCPCGSGGKYKKCCQKYHKGALAKDALTLMKSRYSAYALNEQGIKRHSDIEPKLKIFASDNVSALRETAKMWLGSR